MSTPTLLSLPDVVARLSVTRDVYYKTLRHIPDFPKPLKFGKSIRFREDQLAQFIKNATE